MLSTNKVLNVIACTSVGVGIIALSVLSYQLWMYSEPFGLKNLISLLNEIGARRRFIEFPELTWSFFIMIACSISLVVTAVADIIWQLRVKNF